MTTTTVANSDLEIPELPSLSRWSSKIVMPQRDIVGRINEKHQVLATLARPELCNVALVAEAGTGKSALVQGVARDDTRRDYREVNLPKMISELPATEHMPNAVQDLFEEASQYAELFDRELVLFIDEFHQLVQLSPAAVEAIKPVLAASGQRGIKIIVATTFAEFHEFIAPNQPLVERLERIDLPQTDRKTTIEILRGMAERYGVDHQFVGDGLFGLIHDYTNRYVPASSQPRKSIKVLDAMVGWYQYGGREMDMALLADVIYQTTGNNVALRVDASTIEKRLNERVLAQQFAVSQVTRRLHLCVAGLQDPMRPMGSFLFLGSTGTGKTEMTKQMAKLLFGDDTRHLIRFDMAEFPGEGDVNRFRSELSREVSNRPFAVVLLDEIEKASLAVNRLLLAVLDDGRLSDDYGRQVSFLNTYIVMTTNVGADNFERMATYDQSTTGSGENLGDYMAQLNMALQQTSGGKFPPELLGRVDVIAPFQGLAPETREAITKNKLEHLRATLSRQFGIRAVFDERMVHYITEDNTSSSTKAGGARDVARTITAKITTEVAIFMNNHPNVKNIDIGIEGELASENKYRRVSDAKVVVTARHESK